MIKGLEKLSAKNLAILTRNVKCGIMRIVDMGEDAYVANGKDNAPAAMFPVLRGMLDMLEAEIWSRSMDPRHPVFGPDVAGAINDVENSTLTV
jgi:hypothetical protein